MTELEGTAACLAVINGSAIDATTYPSVSNSKKWPTNHVKAMLRISARTVLGRYAQDPNHPGRAGLLTTVSPAVAHGGTLPSRIGPISSPRIQQSTGGYKPAVPDDPDVVQSRVDNPLGLQLPVYHFAIDGEIVYHTGTGMLFQYVAPSALDDAGGTVDIVAKVLRADELEVLGLALAELIPFDGEDTEAAGFWEGLAIAAHNFVMGGAQ